MPNGRIILGIDPGYDICGFGVISDSYGQSTHLRHGVIRPPKAELSQRLLYLHTALADLVKEVNPDVVGLERLYFTNNAKTAINVGQARGVILLTLAQQGLDVKEFTPLEIKQAITGFGQAPKEQIQKMVQMILKLDALPTPDDAADGLAIALCTAQHLGRV
ncbi:MAG: crossover junction endodeoxyribonuclease RuvC [Patescibacteria group bacterium]